MFSASLKPSDQLMADPPILRDGSGRELIFIDAEKVFPNHELPNGGIRFRYRMPAEGGQQGAIFDFTFKNPPPRGFSFGFRVSTSARQA